MSTQPVCTIMGAGSGMGLALAQVFGSQGYQIVLVARQLEKLKGMEATLLSQGIEVRSMSADLSDPDQVASMVRVIEEQAGPTEVLIYNAAAFRMATATQTTVKQLFDDLALSVGGALVAAQQVLPSMQKLGQGTILFTGGSTAMNPMPGAATLGIGKAAIRNLALSLHQELAPKGIHVGTVTICGAIAPNTHFSPNSIAQQFWKLHKQARKDWQAEYVYE